MPPRPPTSGSPRRRPLVAAGLAAAGLALAALTLLDQRQAERREEQLTARLQTLAIPAAAEGAVHLGLRQNDPTHRELAIARAFVGAERGLAATGEDEAAAVRRLETARDLAAAAVAARPAAWEASLLLGAATYLVRRQTADPRLVTESADWDLPLGRARELAPTAPEPARFSALAYLELWPMLSPEKRELARELLAPALLAGRDRGRLLAAWIEVVDDPHEAMSLLPDVAAVWTDAQRIFAERGDWTSVIEARRRWRRALAAELAERLDAAAERRDAEPDAARREALAVVATAPPEALFLPLVERALAEAPPGPPEPSLIAGSRAWLDWALDLALVGVETLPPPLLGRLAGLAGELPPPLAARAALAAGRFEAAHRIEREAGLAAAGEAWAGYWVAMAEVLAAQGRHRDAEVALDRVVGRWRQSPIHAVAARRTAAAAEDDAAAATAQDRLSAAAGEVDLRHPLSQGERSARFALFTSGPVDALALEIGEGHPATLLEIQLDGRLLDIVRARSGRRLDLDARAGAGLHLVEVAAASGRGAEVRRLAAVP